MPSDDRARSAPLAPPIPNSYWVEPGRLLAGEYPGALSRGDAMERLRRLVKSGITSFIDLTEDEELPPYDGLLAAIAEQRVHHRRLPIRDHDVPESPRTVSQILDAIDAELAAGRMVYVHCRAGIGRTGTVIACYLMRRGRNCEEALDRLQALWQQSARSRNWPAVPETNDQIQFVRRWSEAASPASGVVLDRAARFEGALIGLALGDALGTLVQNGACTAATLTRYLDAQPAIDGGAETGATRCVIESLLALGTHDARDQLQRYHRWLQSAAAARVAIAPDFKRAVAAAQWSRRLIGGSHDPRNLDPHSLSRSLAAALFMQSDPQAAFELAVEVSRTTQQSPVVLDACRLWTALLIDATAGVERPPLVAGLGAAVQQLSGRSLKPQVAALLQGRVRELADGQASAVAVIASALSEFASTAAMPDGLLRVVSASRAAATAGALFGSLAGAYYGVQALPQTWVEKLTDTADLRVLARKLAD